MGDDLIDPRIDATETVRWLRLKDPDLVTRAEQVILHNIAEIMKGQQRLTMTVEALSIAVERLANSQKLNKTRRSSVQSEASCDMADDEAEEESDLAILPSSVSDSKEEDAQSTGKARVKKRPIHRPNLGALQEEDVVAGSSSNRRRINALDDDEDAQGGGNNRCDK